MSTRPLTRYVPIRPAPTSTSRPPTLPALHTLDSTSPTAISRFENNNTTETRHHVEPDLSALYSPASSNNQFEYNVPSSPYDSRPVRPHYNHALATNHSRLRTTPPSVNYGPALSIPTTLPPTPRTTSRHTPQSPAFAVPRVPAHAATAPNPSPAPRTFAPDYLQSYLKMISTPNTQSDPAPNAMSGFDPELSQLIQGVAQPSPSATPYSTPHMPMADFETVRTLEELLTSPEFTSPAWMDTPSLSDASPFTPSSSSTRHQTSPALIDYGDASSGSIPLFGPTPAIVGTPNMDALQLASGGLGFQNLDHLLSMPSESPISPSIDTQTLFSPTTSPLFNDEHSPRPAGQRSVSDPVKKAHPTGHRKNLSPEQLLPVDAPTQQRNYYGPSATSRKAMPAGFEERRAKIVAKRRRGVEAEMTEEDILNAAVEDKRRANTVAARRSRQRKLEHLQNLEKELEEARHGMEVWRERAIAAEKELKEYKVRFGS
ncbi:bZIP transcription factor [Ceratobasidium sp. AG-Ba]|nr:bZIP transcription factor [Ceratobasidium sp. AG-Ba]